MKLNRHNYEEYFILYLDNELDSEGRREVELFASEHPDLKAELDILLQSKLSPDTDITFANKESLLIRDSSSISINNYEQWLLSYVDNELTTEEIKDVERFIAQHPEAKTELGLLQKTKLQPEAIVFPGKESLYRKEEKAKVVAFYWKRWAVAAALLIGISTTAIVLLNNKNDQQGPSIAKQGDSKAPAGTNDSNTNRQPANATPDETQIAVVTPDNKIETSPKETPEKIARIKNDNSNPSKNNKEVLPADNKEKDAIALNNESTIKPGNNLPKPDQNPNVTGNANTANTDNTNIGIADNGSSKKTLTPINTQPDATPVTIDPSKSYNPENAVTGGNETETTGAEFASNNGKKNKLRGFFRKITRTFEKRTNIKATDDEDRLLIAGLAIKLN